jgi:hypothetical protein
MKIKSALVCTVALATILAAKQGIATDNPAPNPVHMKTNVMFIYDSSGSMETKLNGKPKYESARKILKDVLGTLPPDTNMGMVAYGHRTKKDCKDIELVVPFGSTNANSLMEKANSLAPIGITPLSDALLQGAELLRDKEGAKMIVLITDGGEECKGDPCEVVRNLALSGMVVRVNTVGLSPTNLEMKQLQCIAKEGVGRYFDVRDKESLYKAISEIKEDVIEFDKKNQPAAPVAQEKPPEKINVLSAEQGATIVTGGYTNWNPVITGNKDDSAWTWPGQEVTFTLHPQKPVAFSSFELFIPGELSQNVKEFELLAANYSPGGPYRSIGKFTAENDTKGDKGYQAFTFPMVRAKYFKFKVISNYGHPVQGFGSTQVFQMRLLK